MAVLSVWLALAATLGFELTADQQGALRAIASGRDALYIIRTGGGKSLVYLLPLLAPVEEGRPAPLALYVAPLNSLIADQHRKALAHARRLGACGWSARRLLGGGVHI